MLILHSCPSGIGWSVAGTGASFLTSSDALIDGRPARTTRVQWLSAGSPAITDYLSLQASWGTATSLKGCVLRNLVRGIGSGSPLEYTESAFPADVRVEIRGKRSGDAGFTYLLGGNALTQETVLATDGSSSAELTWVFADSLDAVVAVEIRIYNDANGSTFLTADDYIEIGQCFFGKGSEWAIRTQFGNRLDDPSILNLSIGNQPHVVTRTRARLYDIEIIPTVFADAYTSATSLNWLRERLAGYADCVVIPAMRNPKLGDDAAVDYDVINTVAMFGKCVNLGDLRSVSEGPAWALPFGFRESPAG